MSHIVPDRHRATAPLLFEAQAERTPGAIALIHGETALTYGQVNAEANRTAHHLIALGLGPEDIAAIALPRSAAAIVAILGVLKAGAAYLPLDPRSPSRHLARVLDHARPAAILSSRTIAAASPAVTASAAASKLIVIDDDATVAAVARQRGDNPDDRDRRRPLTAGSAAYVIYTSGSTGQPKGVVVTHTGLAPLAAAQAARFGVTADSRVLQFASLGFDASVSEMLMAFSTGASLIVIDDDDRTGAALCRTVIARGITHATFPPALLATLAPADLPVPNIIVAGEACPASVAARWSAGRRLINAYGPTETTVCATMTPPLSGGEAPSIGTPIEGCRVYVLDDDLRPVPAGATGEICVAGPGVARGYLHQPRLTAERFVDDPFVPAGAVDSRMYRTGDLGRWRLDGELEFAGRRDRQVKIGGVRIELDDVETAMREHPLVIDALVLAHTSQHPGPRSHRTPELWPSVAEYLVYDDLLYLAMANDTRRNEAYRHGLMRHAAGKIVLDAGTGAEALLARMSVEAGARHVYAVEYLEETYRKAAACIQRHGLTDRITLIRGDLRTVTLPEPIDVCVSELVGPIASMEGAAPLLNAARRLLAPGGVMLPARATTRVAAVSWPDALADTGFAELPALYARKIFAQAGRRFDLRLCVRHFPHDHVLSTAGAFEDMDFTRPLPAETHEAIELTITKAGRLDGFLLWLHLFVAPGAELDILDHDHCWLPVFVPCDPPLTVTEGDRVAGTCTVAPGANGVNPDYSFDGWLLRADGTRVPLRVETKHATETLGSTALHRRILTALDATTPGPCRAPTAPLQRSDDRDDGANDGVRLTGYAVCRQTEAERREHDARHVAEWLRVYDDDAMSRDRAAIAGDGDAIQNASDGDRADEADAETRGWIDSYTGQPIPAEEMRAWAEETAGRIRGLHPRRVLEIGCGTGLLLTRVAPGCARYIGTDLAPAVLRRLARRIAREPRLSHVELRLAEAGDLAFLDDGGVDVVVLNSVIQYFPSVHYLLDVLRAVLRVVRPHGHIYLGDVRSLPLLEAFHASVQRHHAAPGVPERELRRRIAQAVRGERELVLSPELFEELTRDWPEPDRVEILPKRGAYDNELSRFRYDVLMTLGPTHEPSSQALAPPADKYRRFGTSPSWASFGRARAAVLRDHLRASLPAAMVPERLVVLAEWPMTVNGKIDRDALPEPALESDGSNRSNLAPRSAEEEILHGILTELLDRRDIGRDEDFFALGGHSLMAARLTGRIRSALNVDVPIRTVFESPSIAALARRLWETRGGGVAFTTADRAARIPLTSVQQRLWSLDRRDGGSPQYHLLRAVRIDGELDVAALERAINDMAARHDVLRTSFHQDTDDRPCQVIAPELRITIPLHDLSELDPRERQARVRRFLLADASRPFDLTRAPVMRLALLKIAAHSHVLVRTMHYIVKDGWSEALFNRELSYLYRQHQRGETPALEPLSLQYADFAVWQQRSLEAGTWARGLAYWKRQLRDVPPAESGPRTRAASPASEIDTTIGPEDTAGLRRLNRETGTTLYMTLLAALGVALTRGGPRDHGRDDIIIGAPVANRPVPQLEQVIGCFANPLPLRLRIAPAMTLRELLLQVRQTTLAAYQHQDVPYEQLIEALWPERRGERAPGFQTLLAYHNVPWEPLRLDGLRVEPVKWPQLHARIELEVNAWLMGAWDGGRRGTAHVGVTWTFARDAHEPARVEAIAREFSLAIAAMAGASGASGLDTPLDLVRRPEPRVTLPLARER